MTTLIEQRPASEPTGPQPGTARRRRRGLIAVLVAVTLVGVGATLAMWLGSASQAGGVITNGDLEMTTGTTFTWQETTPNKAAANRLSDTTSSAASTLATFLGVNGDEVELRYHVTATLKGDNLQAKLDVDWNTLGSVAPSLPSGLRVVGYRVYKGDASSPPLVTLTSLGTKCQPAGLDSTGYPTLSTVDLVIAVVVQWTAIPSWTHDFSSTSTATLSTLPLVLSLNQVRG